MDPDDHVCLCYKVRLRKVRTFLDVERPPVASRLHECHGAGTGCQWCVPFLQRLFEQWKAGEEPALPIAPADYARRRAEYRETGQRDPAAERGE